jgi:hypothetical protein
MLEWQVEGADYRFQDLGSQRGREGLRAYHSGTEPRRRKRGGGQMGCRKGLLTTDDTDDTDGEEGEAAV